MNNEEKINEILKTMKNEAKDLDIPFDGSTENTVRFALGWMAEWKDEQLPNNAIVIDGVVYSFDQYVTRGHNCSHCDLQTKCRVLYDDPLCSIFGSDVAEGSFFKKKGRR